MKKIFLTALISFAYLSQPTFALAPAKCPNLNAGQIIWEKTTKGLPGQVGKWEVQAQPNKFDTDYIWVFAIAKVDAANSADAMKQASELARIMKPVSGPDKSKQMNFWSCSYSDGKHPAVAFTY